MTKFNLHPAHLDKWMYQNRADATGDYFPGCLLDNFICSTKRGYAFVYERYVNEWSSVYAVTFVPYKEDRETINRAFEAFYRAGLEYYTA